MLVLGLDFETTGLEPEKDSIIEVGLVLWDSALHQPVLTAGFFMRPDLEIDPAHWAEAEKVHGISMGTVEQYGVDTEWGMANIESYHNRADAICAYFGLDFDNPFLAAAAERNETDLEEKIWIDNRTDFPEPITGKLIHTAAEHGFVNPFPHRAVTDVLTMLRVYDLYSFEDALERAKVPNVTVQALVSYDDREKAKARGYGWTGAPRNQWIKPLKADMVEKERAEAGFKIVLVKS